MEELKKVQPITWFIDRVAEIVQSTSPLGYTKNLLIGSIDEAKMLHGLQHYGYRYTNPKNENRTATPNS
jgi:hypothetical protein